MDYIIKRQYKNIIKPKNYIFNILRNRYILYNNTKYLYDLIQYYNIELYIEISTCPEFESNIIKRKLQIYDNTFIVNNFSIFDNKYNNLYLKIYTDTNNVLETELVKLTNTSYMFYPPFFDNEELTLIENNKLIWNPKKIEIFEKILNLKLKKHKKFIFCNFILITISIFLFFILYLLIRI